MTHELAEAYMDRANNPDKPPPGLSWAEILAEEPFTGQHWEGVYGLPVGSVVPLNGQGDDANSDDSLLSLSLLDDDFGLVDIPSSSSTDESSVLTPSITEEGTHSDMEAWSKQIEAYRSRTEVENLQARQYWRSDWRMDPRTFSQPFNIGHSSSLGEFLYVNS